MGYFKKFYQPPSEPLPPEEVCTFDPIVPLTKEEMAEWEEWEKLWAFKTKYKKEARAQAAQRGRTEQEEFGQGFRAWIYFFKSPMNGLIKIGMTRQIFLYQRFDQIRYKFDNGLEFLGAFEADPKEEKVIQKIFRPFRVAGEWFNPEYPLLFFIERFCIKEKYWYLPRQSTPKGGDA